MNEQTDKPISDDRVSTEPARQSAAWRRTVLFLAGALALAAVVVVGLIFFWPKQGGKPVTAPRSVSFEETPQAPSTADQRLILSPEQLRTVQLKIETVGEQPS